LDSPDISHLFSLEYRSYLTFLSLLFSIDIPPTRTPLGRFFRPVFDPSNLSPFPGPCSGFCLFTHPPINQSFLTATKASILPLFPCSFLSLLPLYFSSSFSLLFLLIPFSPSINVELAADQRPYQELYLTRPGAFLLVFPLRSVFLSPPPLLTVFRRPLDFRLILHRSHRFFYYVQFFRSPYTLFRLTSFGESPFSSPCALEPRHT